MASCVAAHVPSVSPAPAGEPKATKKAKGKRYSRPSICLDYVKGACGAKRFQCKFLHPDLAELQALFGQEHESTETQVCEVWVVTGHCKFGSKCNKIHPPMVRTEAETEALKRKPRKSETGADCNKDGSNEPAAAASESLPVVVDTALDFEAFANSLLVPFGGTAIEPIVDDTPILVDDELGNVASFQYHVCKIDDEEHFTPSGLRTILGKAAIGFDSIFLDILRDLHLVSA